MPSSDPRWEQVCAPLKAFISEARTWDELETWRKNNQLTESLYHNMLAWLEERAGIQAMWKHRGWKPWGFPESYVEPDLESGPSNEEPEMVSFEDLRPEDLPLASGDD
jgi:hypothetical protein